MEGFKKMSKCEGQWGDGKIDFLEEDDAKDDTEDDSEDCYSNLVRGSFNS